MPEMPEYLMQSTDSVSLSEDMHESVKFYTLIHLGVRTSK